MIQQKVIWTSTERKKNAEKKARELIKENILESCGTYLGGVLPHIIHDI